MGRAGTVPVRAGQRMRELYGDHHLVIDAVEDPLADGFSAEVAFGWRFVLRSS